MNIALKKQLYERMLRIRRIEEAIATEYSKQEMRCPVHLSIGQEAVPVGLSAHLSYDDRVYSSHRCHAHYLAKDGSLEAMIAELYGKVTGCCKGKGGSMHLVQKSTGMMGSSALVGGSIPMAVGSAFAFAQEGKANVSVAYFGDGATEEGIFYESMNYAALKKLPVLFICENNLYATYSHQRARQANTDIFRRGEPFQIPSYQIDGNDVEAVFRVSQQIVARARQGHGPALVEFLTYRWRDHVGPNFDFTVGYRTKEEVDGWMEKCPVLRLQNQLIEEGHFTQAHVNAIEEKIQNEIRAAFAAAKAAPLPPLTEVFRDIYA